MALFMSDEALQNLVEVAADEGVMMQTGFDGWHAIAGHNWSPQYAETMRKAFWVGARCCFDSMERIAATKGALSAVKLLRVMKLKRELGSDPFCAPPADHSPRKVAERMCQRNPEASRQLAVAIFAELGEKYPETLQ